MTKKSKISDDELDQAEALTRVKIAENALRAAQTFSDWADIRRAVRQAKLGGASYEPTDRHRALVMYCAISGMPQERLAEMLGMHIDTMRSHFQHELDMGNAAMTVDVGKMAFALALQGDKDMIKYVLSRRGGEAWREIKDAPVQVTVQPGPVIEGRVSDPLRVERALDAVAERVIERINKK